MFVVCVGMGGVTVILDWQNPKPGPVGAWKNGSTYAGGKGRVGEVLSGCTMITTRRLLAVSYSNVEMMWRKVLGLDSTVSSKSKTAPIPQQHAELQGLYFTQTGMTVSWKQRGMKCNMEEEFWAVDSFLGVAASFVSFLREILKGDENLWVVSTHDFERHRTTTWLHNIYLGKGQMGRLVNQP